MIIDNIKDIHPINNKLNEHPNVKPGTFNLLIRLVMFVVISFTFDNKKAAMNTTMIAMVNPLVSNKYINGIKINMYVNDTNNVISKIILISFKDQKLKLKYKIRFTTKEIKVDNKAIIIDARKRASTIFVTGSPVILRNSDHPDLISSENRD